MATTLGKANALRYRSYVYDPETALYYLQSRYYNPGTGRFINADALTSTGQGLLGNNMFAYCLNNPVRYADASGSRCVEKTSPEEDEEEDEYKLIGAGIQIELSGNIGPISVGFGFEVIIYWDTPECERYGNPIVAVYVYNEGKLTCDTKALLGTVSEIIDLLLNNIDLIRVDGVMQFKQ